MICSWPASCAHSRATLTSASPTPRRRAAGATHSAVRAAVPVTSDEPAPTVPMTSPPDSATNRDRSSSAERQRFSLRSTSASYVEPNAYGASFNAARRTTRNVSHSSATSRRISVAEDENLQRPADEERADAERGQQAPVARRQLLRPGATRDQPGGKPTGSEDGAHEQRRAGE